MQNSPEEPPSRDQSRLTKENNQSFFNTTWNRVTGWLDFRDNSSLEEEVAELIEELDPEGKQVTSEERTMLHNILGLNDLKSGDVMVPRADIIAIDYNISLTEIKKTLLEKGHTRMPVYKESLDNVIGFIHIKDLIPFLGSKKNFSIDHVLREIVFIPPSTKVNDLLVKMKVKRVHMALVIDEYGGTSGLVTLEDIMEEIVGEIEDEHDEIDTPVISEIEKGIYEVSARITIEDIEEYLQLRLDLSGNEGEFDTLGGLIFYMLGRIPENGEKIPHPSGITLEVADASPRKINRVRIIRSN